MAPTESPLLTVRSPADLIAAVPYLLGFHPTDSVVAVALRGRRIVFAARIDLPPPDVDAGIPAAQLATVIRQQEPGAATIIGYGPATRVTPLVDALRDALGGFGLLVLDALRVTDGRYWSYLCTDPSCCPSAGIPYDPSTSQVTAAAVFAGQVALPDRAALRAQVAPVDGVAREASRRATVRARKRLADLLTAASPSDPLGDRPIRAAGRAAVRTALAQHRRGERLTDDEVAWLGLLLAHLPVRDHAWERTDGRDEYLEFWQDVVRRVDLALVAAPASLLAFNAWRVGQGALAVVAVERALDACPDYPLAVLLDEVLRNGVPPSRLDDRPLSGSGLPAGLGPAGLGFAGLGSAGLGPAGPGRSGPGPSGSGSPEPGRSGPGPSGSGSPGPGRSGPGPSGTGRSRRPQAGRTRGPGAERRRRDGPGRD